MNEIDYSSIRNMVENGATKVGYGARLYKYCSLIVALRLCDLRYRNIVEFLLTIDDVKALITAHNIDNNKLCKLVSHWRTKDLIDYDEVEEEKKLILGDKYVSATDKKKSSSSVSIVTDKRWNEFIKHYYNLTKKPLNDDMEDLKTYYENYKNVDISAEYLAEQCLAERNSRLSQ